MDAKHLPLASGVDVGEYGEVRQPVPHLGGKQLAQEVQAGVEGY